MLIRAVALWATGLVTLVPYATHYLLLYADRSEYALLITLILFWVFGYWSLAGPLIAVLQVRRVFRALEQAKSKQELMTLLQGPDARDVAIEFIASKNHIPRFLAARVYRLLVGRLAK